VTRSSADLYRLDLTGKEFRHILEFDPAVHGLFTLSRDEQRLYTTLKTRNGGRLLIDGIVAIDISTGQKRQVIPLPLSANVSLQVSPDGRTLLIARQDADTRQTHLTRVAIDGSDYRSSIHRGLRIRALSHGRKMVTGFCSLKPGSEMEDHADRGRRRQPENQI
jgi:hypothetical protein